MPRDGSGVHSLDPGYLAVTGATVLPSNHNPPLEDLSNAITESIARTGVTSITANIPFNDKRITGLGDAISAKDALNLQTGDVRYTSRGFGITATVASNALTITLTDPSGAAIAPTNSIGARFPGASGSASIITIEAPLTLVVSSGSTLGTVNAAPFNLYIGLFNDGGTPRLGITQQATGNTVRKLAARGVSSSLAEGGAGAADSAATWYTDVAVTSKPFDVIARLEFNSGLAAAGTWTAGPDKIALSHAGFLLPGMVVDHDIGVVTSNQTRSETTPIDNTIPQIGEGFELTTVTLTPATGASRFRVSARASLTHNTIGGVAAIHIHMNAVANAIAATVTSTASAASYFISAAMDFIHTPATASAVTYRLRAGVNTGAYYTGGYSATPYFNGTYQSVALLVEEIMA